MLMLLIQSLDADDEPVSLTAVRSSEKSRFGSTGRTREKKSRQAAGSSGVSPWTGRTPPH